MIYFKKGGHVLYNVYKSEFTPDFIYKKIVERLFALLKLTYRSPCFLSFFIKFFLLPCLRFNKNKSLIYISTAKFSQQDLTPTLLVPFLHIPNIIIIQINISSPLLFQRGAPAATKQSGSGHRVISSGHQIQTKTSL